MIASVSSMSRKPASCFTSSSEGSNTKAPRLGTIVTRPSVASRARAARSGVRLTPSARPVSSSGSAWPKGSSALTMASRRRCSTISASERGCSSA